jgi:hypothetical protein
MGGSVRATWRRASVGAAVALAFVGCMDIEHTYTGTSAARFPPKPTTCKFTMRTGGVPPDYQEIGTIGGCSGTSDLLEYKDQIREDVCKHGGDLVVAQVNGYGVYCLGTVFRHEE